MLVFPEIDEVFEDLVLEMEKAVLIVPPVFRDVVSGEGCGGVGSGTDGLELAIEDPMGAPGVKHVGRDDDVSGLMLLHPEGCNSGFIPGAGDRLSDDEDGCLWPATGNEGAAGEVRGFGCEA